MPLLLEVLVAFFVLVGAGFALIGSIGLARLPDFYTRLHGPTKATTLGVGGILIASVLYFTFAQGEVSLHELLITLFLFITAPVSAHLLAKAALHLNLAPGADTQYPPEGLGPEAGAAPLDVNADSRRAPP